jgi:hypothetical protein
MGAPRSKSKGPPLAESPRKPLSPLNRRLLAFLEELAGKPDGLGDAWWDEFEKSLRQNRLRLRRLNDA